MPAAISWRMLFREHGVPTMFLDIYVSEVVLFDASGSNINSQITMASASSRWNNMYDAANAVDGNTATAWYSSESNPMWLRYDFSSPVDIRSFSLRNSTAPTSSPYWVDLQYLTSQGDWVTVSSHWRGTWAALETKQFIVPDAVASSRYWSLQAIDNRPGIGGVAMREFIGGQDLLQSSTIATNSSAASTSALVDGNYSTIWSSNSATGSGWVMADFGVSKSVAVVEYMRGTSGWLPSSLRVLTSADGLDWAVNYVSINAVLAMPASSALALFLDVATSASAMATASAALIDNNGDAFGAANPVPPEYDYYRHGDGYISGVVTINGQPAERIVYLFDPGFLSVIRAVVSDSATGAYDFRPIDRARDYVVMSRDYKAVYNAVVADRVRPEQIQ